MADPLRILIVDDEPLAVERLQILLARMEGVHLAGTACDGDAALRMAEAVAPDLVLLDIAMPGMDGIDVARALGKLAAAPIIVFVTAFDGFAVAAFDVEAVDYLMKPIDPARLARALGRARAHRTGERQPAGTRYLQEFWASDINGLTRVRVDDVDRISAERDYMRIHVDKRSWLINHSLAKLEEELDPARFVRLHRSAIVRKDFVIGLRHDDGCWTARLADGTEQRVGRLYAENARKLSGRAKGDR
ncbi:MAG: hypothetical protein AVDCRST_MAG91-277 [uncultured Sphingomonadaceae bacterium]|uniref:Two-component transcriptional response regulator, LuxR family n=1 Tax=uncultured Sphingomonadaceae bacterium TaxID=169976 RepID=A0A6J4S4A2_9SPHN|nr:MAG: hypothetical protein AVDCRST_MAG91-277 [uncultured Sphingomonadaceae bacterium]